MKTKTIKKMTYNCDVKIIDLYLDERTVFYECYLYDKLFKIFEYLYNLQNEKQSFLQIEIDSKSFEILTKHIFKFYKENSYDFYGTFMEITDGIIRLNNNFKFKKYEIRINNGLGKYKLRYIT